MDNVFENFPASLFPNGIVLCVLQKDPSIAEELEKMFHLRKGAIEPALNKSFCYSSHERNIPVDYNLPGTNVGAMSVWLKPDFSATENQWSITVKHVGEKLQGLDYYINYKPTELFNTIRERSENYVVTYKRNGDAVFSTSVYKYVESGWNMVRFGFEWNSDAVQDRIIEDV